MPSDKLQALHNHQAPTPSGSTRLQLGLAVPLETFAASILHQAAEAILVCDLTGAIALANQAARALCGQDPTGELFETAFPLHLGRGQRPWHLRERRKQPRVGPPLDFATICQGPIERGTPVYLERPDAVCFNLLLSAGPLTDERGQVAGCIITLADMTQYQRSADDLEEERARFRRLTDSNLVGVVQIEQETIVEANRAFANLLGYDLQELLVGRIHWQDLIPLEQREMGRLKKQELMSTGTSAPVETTLVGKDGQRIPALIGGILLDAAPMRWIGFVIDLTSRRSTEQALQQAHATLEQRVEERTGELAGFNRALQSEIEERRRAEQALMASRAEFQALLESAPDAIVSVDEQGRILLVSSQTEKMFGYTREELTGKPVEMLLPSRYQNSHTRHRSNYTRHPSTRPMGIGLDLAGRRKDGSEFPVEISLSPVSTREGTVVMSIIRDITERKRNEEAVAILAARLQQQANLIELAHDTIIVRDMSDTILYWNHGAEETYGWTKEQALGQVTHDLLKTVFPVPLEQIKQALLTVGQWEGELVHTTRDGASLVVASRQVLQRDDKNTPRAVLEINRDVTLRKHAEEKLSESEARFRTLVQQVRDYAIFGLDPAGHVISWNVGAERLNGYTADEIIGRHFSILLPPEAVAEGKAEQELQTAALEGRYEMEAERLRRDGTRYCADIVITALRDPQGELRGFSKVIRDVTDRKEAEEQIHRLNRELEGRIDELAAVNQELEAFSYSVSHDLRAPLRGIAGFSQALSEDYADVLDEQAKDYTRRINAATQRMTQLIDDLLTLSRVSRSEMSRDTTVDLSAVVESIGAQLQAAQPERQVEFVTQKGLMTHGDPRLLRVALENLLGNAWKFTGKVPQARIEFGSSGQTDGKPIYYVRDNGAGFDMQYAGKLFGPFQRLHAATEFPGTGIGLATVQRIIRRHGGRVWAEGQVGQGATFYFTLGN